MKLIAHVSVRRHLIEHVREPDAAGSPPKRVAVFRVLGQSPRLALKMIGARSELPGVPGANSDNPAMATIALALDSGVLSDEQAEVCQAVVAECRSHATELLLCGNDLAQLRRRVAPELATSRWFASVAEMVQQLGKDDARHFG